ncbi:Uncharacterised protein [Clostridioides difficile]|nr:Uncharacterised protein [Clostridioides difficile]
MAHLQGYAFSIEDDFGQRPVARQLFRCCMADGSGPGQGGWVGAGGGDREHELCPWGTNGVEGGSECCLVEDQLEGVGAALLGGAPILGAVGFGSRAGSLVDHRLELFANDLGEIGADVDASVVGGVGADRVQG